MSDPYLQPGTNVLVNLLGSRSEHDLDRLERAVTAIRLAELDSSPVPGAFDLAHLRAVHRWIFQDVYAWAGELRTVEIAKDGITFCFSQHLQSAGAAMLDRGHWLERLSGRERPDVAQLGAALFGDVNQLHPFREGNGRATRAFLRQLLREVGWDINWSDVLHCCGSEAWVLLSRKAALGDVAPVTELLLQNLRPV